MGVRPTTQAKQLLSQRLADLQVDRPWRVLLLALLLTAAALTRMTRLEVKTGFEFLLPQDRPSVRELARVAAKTGGVSTLFVVLRAKDGTPTQARAALRRAGDDLTPRLARIGDPWVGSAEDGVQDAYRFLTARAGLYANVGDLEQTRAEIDARYAYEVSKAVGTLLDDDDKPPAIDAATLKKRFGIDAVSVDRYPDGYYESSDGRALVVAVRSRIMGTDGGPSGEAVRRVRAVVEEAHLERSSPAITYGFAGDLYTGAAELRAVNRDLTHVGVIGVSLLAGVVLLFYLRIRALVTILLTVLVGVSWTFAFTELTIGYLNLATAFLFTIIAGNGINAGIILIARYFEARRKGEALRASIRLAIEETWRATLTAACAAAAAYASLTITEFRGFRDFGFIGAVGMLLCWVGTYWTMPAILVVLERLRPLEPATASAWSRFRESWADGFGRPLAWIIPRAPRVIVAVGLSLACAGVVAVVLYVRSDPMEYDMNNLRNGARARADERRDDETAVRVTGYVGADAMAILVDRPEQVAMLRDALDARRDAAPPGQKPFNRLHALEEMIPDHQAEKISLLLAIKARVVRARRQGFVDDHDWAELSKFLPPDDVAPFGMNDLPAGAARAYTETDGTRGRIVYIAPTEGVSLEDTHYLLRWADAFRETKLPDGSVVLGSGRAVIYADMWRAVIDAVPPAVCFSFLATLAVVAVAFRAKSGAIIVVLALLVGVAWLGGLFALFRIRVNFLNFIALPITFGIGADYAVNIVQRYRSEGRGGALVAVRETGGAVILCSLTTTLGYLALVTSVNAAVRSLGLAAVLGEVSCLLAAVLVLPAGLMLWDQRHAAQEARGSAPTRRETLHW